MNQEREVFLCHASEDKEKIVRPIADALKNEGITYWFDEAEIIWGDSIAQKVNEGLRISRYVIVVFSEAFISRNWPQRELNSVVNIEASSGEVRVLPLMAATEETKRQILEMYPILSDKKYESWDYDAQKIVESLLSRLSDKQIKTEPTETDREITYDIPLPKIKKKITQRDKDIFLKESFGIIKSYFQKALKSIEKTYPEIDTDYTEIHNFKFICTIYWDGEIQNKCKIWLGGMMSSDQIAYQEGEVSIENDSSYNNWLSIKEEVSELKFEIGNKYSFGTPQSNETAFLINTWSKLSVCN